MVAPELIGVTLKDVPEQIAAGVTPAITGFGLTVTVTVKAVPVHPLTIGVTV